MDNILNLALEAWRGGAELRRRRLRYKQYTYGNQWADIITTPHGKVMSEGDYARKSGMRPLTNNMIRQLVKCVIGNFRSSLRDDADTAAALCAVDTEIATRNNLTELDCRMLEEFLISGCAIQRVVSERRMAGAGTWIDNISPDRFFINRFCDPRGLDIELTGMLHDLSLREMLLRFGGGDKARTDRIAAIYAEIASRGTDTPIGDGVATEFFTAPDGRCRVIEIWTLESRNIVKCHDPETAEYYILPADSITAVTTANQSRATAGKRAITTRPRTTMRWHCRFMTPTGEVLQEYDSPYPHGMHPFVIKFYPLTDGEVHSFVEDIIDQQRYINRLITLIDHIMSVSAKGVLLFPIDQKPDCYTWEEIGRLWAHCNSIIPYERGRCDGEPKLVIASGESAGAYQLLNLQMQLFQQISGVSGALQGHLSSNNTSAALYDSQVRTSAIAILDILDSYNAFRLQRNRLVNYTQSPAATPYP